MIPPITIIIPTIFKHNWIKDRDLGEPNSIHPGTIFQINSPRIILTIAPNIIQALNIYIY